jgi:Ca2+-transporting ATPase
VDKTGTLTENRMTLTRVVAGEHTVLVTGGADPWPEDCRAVLDAAILASQADPFDPMERALHIAAARLPSGKPTPHAPQLLVREYPLAPALLAVTQVWQQSPTAPLLAASKGAPEAIADLCCLSAEERSVLAHDVARLASLGVRVLGVARAELPAQDLLPIVGRKISKSYSKSSRFLGRFGIIRGTADGSGCRASTTTSSEATGYL